MEKTFSLDEEVRDGHIVTKELKAVWNVELDLLDRFLKFCADNNLKCWVDGGTMLGAVRHKGFIPWDDDVDMVMPRADYDRMIELAPKYFNYPYFLQSAYSDIEFPRTRTVPAYRYGSDTSVRFIPTVQSGNLHRHLCP